MAELRAGVALLPAGKHRNTLHEFLRTLAADELAGRGIASACDAVMRALADLSEACAGIDGSALAALPYDAPVAVPASYRSS